MISGESTMTTPRKSGGTIAIVDSTAFDFDGPNGSFDESVPAGQSFALFVEQRLSANGSKTASEPVSGEEGWTFDAELDDNVYRIFVHWAPIGDPPRDRWIIQTDVRKSLLRSLVGGKTVEADILTALNLLHRVLTAASEIDEITWITNEEFVEMY
jgi:hypothetical protein